MASDITERVSKYDRCVGVFYPFLKDANAPLQVKNNSDIDVGSGELGGNHEIKKQVT